MVLRWFPFDTQLYRDCWPLRCWVNCSPLFWLRYIFFFRARQAYIILGAHKPLAYEDTQLQIVSSNVIVHEDYDGEIGNDIAVIGLPETITLTDAIGTIGLPSADSGDFAGQIARASGWGFIYGHGPTLSDVLNYVDLEIITNEECEEVFGTLDDTILCTSGDNNTSTCSGDSGGPLVIDGSLVGITSFGVQYCPGGYPAAFTRVTTFLEWLATNTDVKI